MGHDPAEYWKSFGSFSNETTKAIEETTGNSAKKLNGDKYDEQVGHAVGKQVGNKSSIQTGWSNSVLQGFSFSTTLGQSTSTTVGIAVSNHIGTKWGMFVGPEMSINAATSVKVAKGGAYTFDTVTKCETAAQKIVSDAKKNELAGDLTRTIGQEISTLTGFSQIVGGLASVSAADYRINATGAISLWSAGINIDGEAAVSVSGVATSIEGTGAVVIKSGGPATINGLVIKIG